MAKKLAAVHRHKVEVVALRQLRPRLRPEEMAFALWRMALLVAA